MFLMFAGLFAEIAFVASNKPVGYVDASVAIAVLGFTLLPAGGAVEWFLPWDGRYARLTRGLTLFGTGSRSWRRFTGFTLFFQSG